MNVVIIIRGVLRHQMGYHDAAIADLSMAISLSPTHSVLALYNRAICHHTIGNIDQVGVVCYFNKLLTTYSFIIRHLMIIVLFVY